MPAARPQDVSDASDRKRTTGPHLRHAREETVQHVARIVDPLAHAHQLAGDAELCNDTRWDAEAGSDPIESLIKNGNH